MIICTTTSCAVIQLLLHKLRKNTHEHERRTQAGIDKSEREQNNWIKGEEGDMRLERSLERSSR